MKDVVCFEVNDWHNYPKFFDEWYNLSENDKHPGRRWFPDLNAYAKENKLCIKVAAIDMAISLVITAPKDWVKKNIPEFEDERWVGYCVYKYPHPWINDYIYWQFDGIEPKENENYVKERKANLEIFHQQFTEEEIENFKPHNTYGQPSGESFLDWAEENFGAIEVDYYNNHIWRVINNEIVEFDENGEVVKREAINGETT